MGGTRRAVLASGLASLVSPALARPPAGDSTSAFFVGNSFLRQHNVPQRVGVIAGASGVRFAHGAMLSDGSRLMDHVRTSPGVLDVLRENHPEILVLQDHSIQPLTPRGRAASVEALRSFEGLSDCLLLIATWARRTGHALYGQDAMPSSPEEMTEIVHAHYAEQATRLGGALAPVGRAWRRAIDAGYALHAKDGYHANPTGAHLTALTLAHAMGFALRQDDPLAEIAATT